MITRARRPFPEALAGWPKGRFVMRGLVLALSLGAALADVAALTPSAMGAPAQPAGAAGEPPASPEATASAAGRTKTVVTEGAGSGADDAAARDEAIKDALRRATEEAVGVLVDAKTLVRNLQLVEDTVYTRSRGHVRTYRVVGEGRRGPAYRVRVEAVVSLEDIGKDLEDIADRLKLGSDPRVLLLLEGAGADEAADLAQSEIADALLEKGFRVVDGAQAAEARTRAAAVQLAADPDGDAAASARRLLMPVADILITGRVVRQPRRLEAIGGEELFGASARCDLRAVHVDTGELVARRAATSPPQASSGSPEAAGEKAVRRAARAWLDACLPRLVRAGADPARTIQVTLRGAGGAPAAGVERALSRLRFARSVRARDQVGDLSSAEVEWLGDARSLSAALEALPGFSLRVTAVTANTISVRVGDRIRNRATE